jgi:hypothetical protein
MTAVIDFFDAPTNLPLMIPDAVQAKLRLYQAYLFGALRE